jgi:hypothetical protein
MLDDWRPEDIDILLAAQESRQHTSGSILLRTNTQDIYDTHSQYKQLHNSLGDLVEGKDQPSECSSDAPTGSGIWSKMDGWAPR